MVAKITKTLAHEYSSESTQGELSNEYQHDKVSKFFQNLCVLVLWMKAASALEGLNEHLTIIDFSPGCKPRIICMCFSMTDHATNLCFYKF